MNDEQTRGLVQSAANLDLLPRLLPVPLADALAVAHRDLKPGNIMVTESGRLSSASTATARAVKPTASSKGVAAAAETCGA